MILVYEGNLNAEHKRELEEVLKSFSCRQLNDDHLDQTMETLSGPDYTEGNGSINPDRPAFLYFVDEDLKDVSRIQNELEARQVPLACMAIETDNNKTFTLRAQMDEVAQEALYFEKINELTDLLQQADPMKMATDKDYANCHLLAARLLREEEISENMLETALSVIRSFHPEKPE